MAIACPSEVAYRLWTEAIRSVKDVDKLIQTPYKIQIYLNSRDSFNMLNRMIGLKSKHMLSR